MPFTLFEGISRSFHAINEHFIYSNQISKQCFTILLKALAECLLLCCAVADTTSAATITVVSQAAPASTEKPRVLYRGCLLNPWISG